jgi:hypothetical protein
MNQVRKTVVRWAAKIVPQVKTPAPRVTATTLRRLDEGQLRQVVGGDGGVTDSPKGNW